MRDWSAQRVAREAGARLVSEDAGHAGPALITVDSRQAGPGALFVGLRGERTHGGAFAAQALANGAWGVLSTPEHVRALDAPAGNVFEAQDPLRALQRLATAWRRELGARVIAVTGSTGKTTTKDLLAALLAPHRATVASRANFNNELGVPLEILAAPAGTEVLVLELAMRAAGEIDELARIAQPDVGVIVNVGPAHLERLGSLEAIAAAKAELIAALAPGATAVVPAREPLLERHLRGDLHTVSFGERGDVRLASAEGGHLEIDASGERIELEANFTQAHLREDLLAAVAAARAVGVTPAGAVELPPRPGRGRHVALADHVTLIDDCYNANPMSMRAALEDLAATAAARPGARRVAVLGDMLELGPTERELHAQLGELATRHGVEVLVAVGPLAGAIAERFDGELHATQDAVAAAALVERLVAPGDVVLVKGSRGVHLELVCEALERRRAEVAG